MRLLPILCALVLLCATDAAPFFDAIYNAMTGGRGWGYYNYYPSPARHSGGGGGRHEKSYKDLCRVHNPSAVSQPGLGPVICPY